MLAMAIFRVHNINGYFVCRAIIIPPFAGFRCRIFGHRLHFRHNSQLTVAGTPHFRPGHFAIARQFIAAGSREQLLILHGFNFTQHYKYRFAYFIRTWPDRPANRFHSCHYYPLTASRAGNSHYVSPLRSRYSRRSFHHAIAICAIASIHNILICH